MAGSIRTMEIPKLRIGSFEFASRLLVGTGKYETYELMRDEDFLKRGMMQEIEQPERGKVTVAGWPLQMSGSHVPIKPTPVHGSNNEDVYGEWLGMEADKVKAMRERGEI